MSLLLANLPRAGVFLAAVLIAFGWRQERMAADPTASVAFDVEAVGRVCAAENYPESYFWERVRTMGGRVALLRSEPVSRLIERGLAFRFTREEIDKMRATGAAAEEAPLSPDSVWAEDAGVAARLRRGAEAAGISVEMKTYRGRGVLPLPAETEVTAGFDPERAASLRRLGLIPAYALRTPADLRLALDDPLPAVYWIEGGWVEWSDADAEALRRKLALSDSWIVWSAAGASAYPGGAAARSRAALSRRRRLEALGATRSRLGVPVPPAAGSPGTVSLARARRFMEFAPDPGAGVEGNLLRWRRRFSALRRSGFGAGPPSFAAPVRAAGKLERAARRVFGAAALLLGPLGALMFSRRVLRTRGSPALAFGGAVVAAGLAGLLGRSGAAPSDALLSESYRLADPVWTALVVTAAAFAWRPDDPRSRRLFMSGAALIALVGAFASPAPFEFCVYWMGTHWAQTLVGCAVLWIALRNPPDASGLWTVAGLLGLIGIVQGVSDCRIPLEIAVFNAAAAVSAGALSGGVILGVSGLIVRDRPVVQ